MTSTVSIKRAAREDLVLLKPLWAELYSGQQKSGMQLKVPENGFELWVEGFQSILNRFGCVVIASDAASVPCGFVASKIKAIPSWFGGGQAGYVSEVFVQASHRGKGIAEAMLRAATTFYLEHGITRLELQVLPQNDAARRRYRNLGWTEELIQMTLHTTITK